MTFQLNGKGRLMLAVISAMMLAACDGDDGKDGAQGPAGPQGPEGPQGPAGQDGADGADGSDGSNGSGGGSASLMTPGLTRLATVPAGAEVTGAYVTEQGDLFFNAQHPSDANSATDSEGKTFHTGTVGVLAGVNVNKLPKNLVSVGVPETIQERETVQVAYGEYQVLAQTADTFGGGLPEGIGNVMATDGSTQVVSSDMPDFNAYIPTGDNEGYLFTNWESIPGGMSRIKLNKDASTGYWSVDSNDVQMLDFGTYGTIANCFGSVSPWGTPLTSEEWGNQGDNTEEWNDPSQQTARDMLAMYIDPTATDADGASSFPNTYRYHYIVEITEPTSDKPVPVKHYTMGRFEHENSIVMPDSKTVYLSQDDTNGVFFKFVADNAGDLSSGTLYGAKLTQDAGSFEPLTTGFDIEWIELAHSDNATIDGWIADFDDITTADFVEGQSNYLTDADAEAWAAGEANYPSVADGGGSTTAGMPMDDRIAFLESRKAARAKGATAEWRKFEGIYVNHKRAEEAVEGTDLIEGEEVNQAYVYFAIADMDNGMVDDEGDIQLTPRVKDCGGVYRMPLMTGADAYDVSRIEPVVMGSTYRSSLDGAERCDVNALSQPDNVIVLEDGRIVIGEDGFQENNTLWMYDPSVNE
ncbi:alkaline phosphatase PhoX [Gilvimarinus chinensis]|uniref:alkaline phosphatase PhoX n=1 Tax=Gilvimarinus chinensis TaxID=396005 RepID=UPI00036EC58E|nr:alkaline phosphatase PhoX [Gilvimarinus chinensis]